MTPHLRVHTLILGGGLTGLSTAYHLEKSGHTDYLLVEQKETLGGLCASIEKDGFTFDYSGHLLHLRNPYAISLVRQLLRGNLLHHTRRAFIDFQENLVPFPFQANLWALPPAIRRECVHGLQMPRPKSVPRNFEQWCLHSVGPGIYKHFMRPYNRKLWRTLPKNLTCDWCGPFIPQAARSALIQSAQKPLPQTLGYNAQFYYPKHGGCGALIHALSAHVPNIWLNARVKRIYLKEKLAVIAGKRIQYTRLVNTLPLKDFTALTDASTTTKKTARVLRATRVQVLNVAIDAPAKPGIHWIYFPQKDFPFYRVGVQSAFAPSNAPENCSSFYAETATAVTNQVAAQKALLTLLKQKGIIEKQAHIRFAFWQTLPCAYAVYNAPRTATVKHLLQYLHKYGILCAGRYGLWEYSFMERSLLQGREAAQQVQQ